MQILLFTATVYSTALVNIISFNLKKIPNREVSNVVFKELYIILFYLIKTK